MRVNRPTGCGHPKQPDAVEVAQRARPEIQRLVEALRDELVEYGAMLVLLDQQQKLIITRRATDLLDNAGSMSDQVQTLAAVRATRQRLDRELADALGCPRASSFGQLVASAPGEDQSVLRALVEEINRVLFHCQQRLLQNKLLLGPPPSDPTQTPEHARLILFGLN